MSLDLTRLRKASHDNISVGGSYTDTMITAQGMGQSAAVNDAYIRWVPNNKSGSGYYSGNNVSIDTSNLVSKGYLEFNAKSYKDTHILSDGYHCLKFNYYDDTNEYNGGSTSPGIRLADYEFVRCENENLNNGANTLDGWYTSTQKCVIVIVNTGNIHHNPTWLSQFVDFRSWRMTKNVTGASKNWSYATVITNVNNIGTLSESLQGEAATAANANIQLVIEHKANTIGHAGYGEDLSSGVGAGTISYTGNTNATIATKNIPWDSAGKDKVLPGEKLRITVFNKTQAGARAFNGNASIKLTDGTTQYSYDVGSIDVYKKYEFLHTRQSAIGAGDLELEVFASVGSGAGNGAPYDNIYFRDLEIYKSGFRPELERDVAVHKWHINALNIAEGPANFDIAKPEEFLSFYNSDRNLADTTYTYPVHDFGNGTHLNWISMGGSGGTGAGRYNRPWFGEYEPTSTSTQAGLYIHEARNSTANTITDQSFGWNASNRGINVDSNKIYMAGAWFRVKEASAQTSQKPGRVSLVTSADTPLKGYDGTSYSTGTRVYGPSINDSSFNHLYEWRLFTIFYLPYWMSAAEITAWHDDYFGIWAGQYEMDNQIVSTSNGTGLTTPLDGRVIQMTEGTKVVSPYLRTETYQTKDIWHETCFPFFTEIDPMNLNAGGDAHFWDFTEA